MSPGPVVNATEIDALRRLDTSMVSNAVETFDVRLRNTGFADARIHCMSEGLPPMVGYAATARMRSGEPPIAGRIYHERGEWWQSILKVPAPRIVVLEDIDSPPGRGAFLGDMHAAILRALGCVGYVTNGAVRELQRVRGLGLHVFAGNLAVSHAYAHIFDFENAVQIGGLTINPGDLLHGDENGLLAVPKEIAGEIPQVAVRLEKNERTVIEFCRSEQFSVDGLCRMLKELF
jgi:4-hydroxy-4-methyl-2-oxoglutarate aldolase